MENLTPGRELDALIAEKVMGLNVQHGQIVRINRNSATTMPPKPYSTDIGAAWEVVEKLRNTHADFSLQQDQGEYLEWAARFGHEEGPICEAPSAPHAICLAALKAVGFTPTQS